MLFTMLKSLLLLLPALSTAMMTEYDVTVIFEEASGPINCTSSDTCIDTSIVTDYIGQFCGMVSAATPDWLIKYTDGNVYENIVYAFEAADDNYNTATNPCSTKCVAAFQNMILDCTYLIHVQRGRVADHLS